MTGEFSHAPLERVKKGKEVMQSVKMVYDATGSEIYDLRPC